MRFFTASLLVAAVAARRSAPPPRKPFLYPTQDWGYPHGWGFDDDLHVAEPDKEQLEKIKHVKRVVKKELPPKKATGWFGIKVDPDHDFVHDIEDALDGLE